MAQLRESVPQNSFEKPSDDPKERLKELRTITAAYKSLNSTEPSLPQPTSPLPVLLALRSTLNTINQTKTSIKETYESIKQARENLHQEEGRLKDAQQLTTVLESRIDNARRKNEELSLRNPEELAKAMIEEERQKEEKYSTEMAKLIQALNTFVDEHLAAMIAAEDLGGPVMGDLIGVDPEMLKAGFTSQSKPKKTKRKSVAAGAIDGSQIDETFFSESSDSEQGPSGATTTAGAKFRELMEDLLNAAAGDEDSGPYVRIEHDSAAVRFLVRAKIAQFHPQDARKLRLIDFGQEFED